MRCGLFSAAVTFGYPGMPLWEELATLVTVMLLGHWIEMPSIFQAQGALKELAKLLPAVAVRVVDGREEEVPLSALRDGDLVLLRPGARVSADGLVRPGESALDEAMITGESRALKKREGDRVVAGTVNGAGSLRAECTALRRIRVKSRGRAETVRPLAPRSGTPSHEPMASVIAERSSVIRLTRKASVI